MNQAEPNSLTLNNPYLQHVKRKWSEAYTIDTDVPSPKFQNTSKIDDNENKNEIEVEDEEELKIKRKEQNRAAQRAFRERKERYVKDLEMKIKQVQENHLFSTNQLYQENQQLKSIIYRLEAENFALKGLVPSPIHSESSPSTSLMFPLMCFSPTTTPTSLPLHNTNTNNNNNNLMKSKSHPKPLAAKPIPTVPQQNIVSHLLQDNSNNEMNISLPKEKPQQQQQQNFTFSITTPDTLRANESEKNNVSNNSPIELIPLYHPNHQYSSKPTSSSSSSSISSISLSSSSIVSPIISSSPSSITLSSPNESLSIQQQPQQPSSSPSFLDGYDVFEHLLMQQESLYNDHQKSIEILHENKINEILIMENDEKDDIMKENEKGEEEEVKEKKVIKKEKMDKKEELFMNDQSSSMLIMKKDKNHHDDDLIHSTNESSEIINQQQLQPHFHQIQQVQQEQQEQQQQNQQIQQQNQHPNNRHLSEHDERSPIWNKITEHAENNKFNIDHLLEAVKHTTTSKRENKSLVDEWELESMIQDLNYYL